MTQRTREPFRICYTSGGWQLISLAAALRAHRRAEPDADRYETVVAAAGPGLTPAMRVTVETLTGALIESDGTTWIDDLAAGLASADDRQLGATIASIRARFCDEPVELWLSNPFSGPDRLLLESFPNARVILYEDGLLTYARPWSDTVAPVHRARATLRWIADLIRGDRSANARAFRTEVRPLGWRTRRTHAAYLTLADHLGVPRDFAGIARRVETEILRGVLRDVPAEPIDRSTHGELRALLIGGNFSTWNLMPRESERELYTRIAAHLDSAGYAVWWKDHPRVAGPFLPEIRQALPNTRIHAFESDHTLPLEVVLQYDPVDLLVGGLSSSLLFGPMIGAPSIRAATFANEVRPLLPWPWARVGELIESAVPTVEDVLRGAAPAPRRQRG